jgi:low affinity Fe/Cu permease
LKVDELIRVTKEAQNAMLGLESLDLKQLEALRKQYRSMGESETIALEGATTQSKSKSKPDWNQC